MALTAMVALCAIAGCNPSGRSRRAAQMPLGLFESREARQRGRELFMENCAICHGEAGDGRGRRSVGIIPPPANLTSPPWSDSASAVQTYDAIHDGVQGAAMPSWRTLTDRQIWDLVAYIHSLGES